MHRSELHLFRGETWLSDLIEHAVEVGACVRWGCTTCGAMALRRALRDSASAVLGDQKSDGAVIYEITNGLRGVHARPELIEAIRFIIMFLDAQVGSRRFEQELLP